MNVQKDYVELSKKDLAEMVRRIFYRLDIRKQDTEIRHLIDSTLLQMESELRAAEEAAFRELEDREFEKIAVKEALFERLQYINEGLLSKDAHK